jgi:hypothetical protein
MSDDIKPPYWEIHIRPMFRLLDQEHMIGDSVRPEGRVDLYSYDQVSKRATDILGALQDNFMPPGDEGGPWPPEWVALFARWVEKECKRLARGKATWTAVRSGGTVLLTAEVSLPNGGDQTWIEPVAANGPARRFVLYREPSATGEPSTVSRSISFRSAGGADYVIVEDAEGERRVPITA